MNRSIVICLVTLAVSSCVFIDSSSAQALWPRRIPRHVNHLADITARRVGDTLTVLIRENTDVQNHDQRALDKESSGGVTFDFAGSSSGGGSPAANLDLAGNSNRSFDGNSQYRVEQEFIDSITVEVIDIKPNGNLVLFGQRSRTVADETRTLKVSGIARPSDISHNNTIRSEYIANFTVKYEGCGPESHFTHQGWFGRTLNRVWPF